MITSVASEVERFDASVAQLDRGRVTDLPRQVNDVISESTRAGWVVRVQAGSAKRVRFWSTASAVVTAAELDDPGSVGPALMCSGPAALVHLAELWIPDVIDAARPSQLPTVTLGDLVAAVRSDGVALQIGVLQVDEEPRRAVVVRSGSDLLRGSVDRADELVELRRAGLAGLWSEIVGLVDR